MLGARQLQIVENCHKGSYRPIKKLSNFCPELINRLAAYAVPIFHRKGAFLFAEGRPSRGIFIVYSGRVKLFTSAANGKTCILRFAAPEEILGLAGTLLGQPYEMWAEATQPTQTGFVESRELVNVMRHSGEVSMQLAMVCGESYISAITRVRLMGHSRCVRQKLALFLLDWCKGNRPFHEEATARLTLTHEEIAQVIGTSRETVTRLLSGFKKKGLIRWNDCNLVLNDTAALQHLAVT
jgi:CRP/FNR family transcriptional regulator, cyclic AMP receptor protein